MRSRSRVERMGHSGRGAGELGVYDRYQHGYRQCHRIDLAAERDRDLHVVRSKDILRGPVVGWHDGMETPDCD